MPLNFVDAMKEDQKGKEMFSPSPGTATVDFLM